MILFGAIFLALSGGVARAETDCTTNARVVTFDRSQFATNTFYDFLPDLGAKNIEIGRNSMDNSVEAYLNAFDCKDRAGVLVNLRQAWRPSWDPATAEKTKGKVSAIYFEHNGKKYKYTPTKEEQNYSYGLIDSSLKSYEDGNPLLKLVGKNTKPTKPLLDDIIITGMDFAEKPEFMTNSKSPLPKKRPSSAISCNYVGDPQGGTLELSGCSGDIYSNEVKCFDSELGITFTNIATCQSSSSGEHASAPDPTECFLNGFVKSSNDQNYQSIYKNESQEAK